MSRGVNKAIIVGNLGNDPESNTMPQGGMVTNITVATSEEWKDKQTGQKQSRTEWHKIVFFNKLAEIAAEYLKKGSKVYIEGSMRTRKWQDQSGADRYTTEIVASELQMLDKNPNGQAASQYNEYQGQYSQPPQQPVQGQPQAGTMPPAPATGAIPQQPQPMGQQPQQQQAQQPMPQGGNNPSW